MGLASDIWQFIGLRLLAGIAGGYSSRQRPGRGASSRKSRSAWALGLLSSGVMAGELLGPLVGGFLPSSDRHTRATFWGASGPIFIALSSRPSCCARETARPSVHRRRTSKGQLMDYAQQAVILAMLATGLLLMIANVSVEPIITVYIEAAAQGPKGG